MKQIGYYGYRITNLLNGKIYIGIHKLRSIYIPKLGDNKFPDKYFGGGTALKRSINKHGIENFQLEILYKATCIEELSNWEKEIVTEEFIKRQDTYNLKTGGEFGGAFCEESIKKLKHSLSLLDRTGINNAMYGKQHTEEAKQIMKDARNKNHNDPNSKYHTQEYRDKISEANTGSGNGMYGKKHKQSTKDKMSKKAKNRTVEHQSKLNESYKYRPKQIVSEEKKKLMSKYHRAGGNPAAISLQDTQTNIIYGCI